MRSYSTKVWKEGCITLVLVCFHEFLERLDNLLDIHVVDAAKAAHPVAGFRYGFSSPDIEAPCEAIAVGFLHGFRSEADEGVVRVGFKGFLVCLLSHDECLLLDEFYLVALAFKEHFFDGLVVKPGGEGDG